MNTPSNDLFHLLRLSRTKGIGSKRCQALIKEYKTAEQACKALQERKEYQAITIAPKSMIQQEIEETHSFGAQFITIHSPEYPSQLKQIADHPIVLSVLGSLSPLSKPNLAIVGSRLASIHNRYLACSFAKECGKHGIIITSGLARGIDENAHQGALLTGTIGVIGCGINIVYPRNNQELYQRIPEEGGSIISELPFNAPPIAENFPKRNRIIAGLSKATLVIEARIRSGSLITANLALDYGRDVLAVPGSPVDDRCRGSNQLIKQGALLVESVNDILDFWENGYISEEPILPEHSLPNKNKKEYSGKHSNDVKKMILSLLSTSPVDINHIIVQTALSPSSVNIALGALELEGKITRHPGNRVARLFEEMV